MNNSHGAVWENDTHPYFVLYTYAQGEKEPVKDYFRASDREEARRARSFVELLSLKSQERLLPRQEIIDELTQYIPNLEHTQEAITDVLTPPASPELYRLSQQHQKKEQQSQEAIKRSAAYETISNLPLVFMAVASSSYGEVMPVLGWASLVYVPLTLDYVTSRNRESAIKKSQRKYRFNGSNQAFDGLGLGLQSTITEHKKAEGWKAIFHDVASLLPNPIRIYHDPKAPEHYGLPGHLYEYGDVTLRPTLRFTCKGIKALGTLFKNQSDTEDQKNNDLDNRYITHSDTDGKTERIIRTQLPSEVTYPSTIEVPAEPERLKKALQITKQQILTDKFKVAANMGAMFAIAEFCIQGAQYAYHYTHTALASPTIAQAAENGSVALIWGVASILGACTSIHFVHDRKKISEELGSKKAYAATKEKLRQDRERDVGRIRDILEEYEGQSLDGAPMNEVLSLYARMDPYALTEKEKDRLSRLVVSPFLNSPNALDNPQEEPVLSA